MYGEWPEHGVDHIDNDSLNNRIANLRQANRSQNGMNRGPQANSKSGLKGVCWHKKTKSWIATIKANGRLMHLGSYATTKEAQAAYAAAAEKYHGAFARIE